MKYRLLNDNEIIRIGDEFRVKGGEWLKCQTSIGFTVKRAKEEFPFAIHNIRRKNILKPVKTFDQKQSCADLLKVMKRCTKKGLTVGEYSDMGGGCDMRKRISELARDGYTFRSVWEPNKTTRGRHKRYFLVSCPRGK